MSRRAALASRLHALVQRLGTPRALALSVLAGTALASASIGRHLVLDDHILALLTRADPGIAGLGPTSFDLFTFTTGDPERNRQLMDRGVMLPWWTAEELRIAFYRPLASLTHHLDAALWPGSAALMHAHSLAWLAALLAAVASVYRRLDAPAWLAGFAALLYAIDHTHAPTVSWLANRNALIAGVFGCIALVAHDRFRRGGSRSAGLLAPLALLVGLMAGEFAIGVGGYLLAHALFLDPGRFRARALALLPYAAVVIGWRLVHRAAGYGAAGSGAYIDPLADPLRFLAALPEKLVVLLHGQLSLPPSDVAFLGPPAHRPLVLAVAVTTVVLFTVLLAPLLRRDRTSRFWAAGMLLSAIPVSASFPSDRLLLFVGVGAMPLLARLFSNLFREAAEPATRFGARGAVTAAFAALHLVASPLLLPVRARQMEVLGEALERAEQSVFTHPGAAGGIVVLLGAPNDLFANYLQASRVRRGEEPARHLYWLASAGSELRIERSGEAAVVVRPAAGFLYTPLERHYRGDPRSMPIGHEVHLSAMTARVLSLTDDGRPGAVEFRFTRPLEDYLFLRWERDRYAPAQLPAVGEQMRLPAEDVGEILMRAAVG